MSPISPSVASSSSTHLSYYTPSNEKKSNDDIQPAPSPPVELSKTRLYVGGLHPTVDEYTFLQIFNKFGKITKLDFLFHKGGPSKGKTRGYAFVEYKDEEDALKALVNAHDKPLRGRKLVVTYANQAPMHENMGSGPGNHHKRGETQRRTTLSLLKSTSLSKKTEDKIAAMEAKLRQMEKDDTPRPSTLPSHPSLPLKPPPELLTDSVSSKPLTSNTPSSKTESTVSQTSLGSATNIKKLGTPKPVGIFASGSSSKLGKKPTIEELMRSKKLKTSGGFLKQ